MSLLDRLLKQRILLSVLLLAVLPFTLQAAIEAFRGLNNDVKDWLPEEFQATKDFRRFVEVFGSDELLMISWDDCEFGDDRIDLYAEQLTSAPSAEKDPYFRKVITGPEIKRFYQEDPLKLDDEQTLKKMQGWMVGRDGQATCLVALVSEAGRNDRHSAIAYVYAATEKVPGLNAADLHVAGPTNEGVEIDQVSTSNLLELNLSSYGICLLIMVISLRHFRAAMLVFLLAVFNEILSMAIIHYSGSNMDSILLLTANLTFVLTISIAIHLVNYYRDELHANSENPISSACQAALRPTFLATLTTAFGLVSLTVSEIRPITKFGGYSAVSICVGMIVTLVYIALHFSIWPMRLPPGKVNVTERTNDGTWTRYLNAAKWPVVLLAVGAIIGGAFGVVRLHTSLGLSALLPPESKLIQDYAYLEERIGPLIPVEVLVEMPTQPMVAKKNERETNAQARALLEQFKTIAAIHEAFEELDDRNVVISTTNFAPKPPRAGRSFRQIAANATFRNKLLENQEALRELGYLEVREETHYWRITVRTPSTRERTYGLLIDQLRETVDRIVGEEDRVKPLRVTPCGGIPLVFEAQQQLLDDLKNSFVLAFGLVAVTLMLLFRSFVCGLICMIPNILPCAVVFGTMGWLGVAAEIGTILTACAAMGVAVDDSLHFISWFQKGVAAGESRSTAIRYAYQRCASAMIQTTLICSLGLVVFSMSPFAPIARFGWSMCTLLSVALLADLVVLPAILLSPLGRPFETRSGKNPIAE